jgi:hypothetical protein
MGVAMKPYVALLGASVLAGCAYAKEARVDWGTPLVYVGEATAANRAARQQLLRLDEGVCFLSSVDNAHAPSGWTVHVAKGGDAIPAHWWLEVAMMGPRVRPDARIFGRAVCYRYVR